MNASSPQKHATHPTPHPAGSSHSRWHEPRRPPQTPNASQAGPCHQERDAPRNTYHHTHPKKGGTRSNSRRAAGSALSPEYRRFTHLRGKARPLWRGGIAVIDKPRHSARSRGASAAEVLREAARPARAPHRRRAPRPAPAPRRHHRRGVDPTSTGARKTT